MKNTWIKYDKDKPPTEDRVIGTNGTWVEVLESGNHKGEHYFRNDTGIVVDVTHWMSFPSWKKGGKS